MKLKCRWCRDLLPEDVFVELCSRCSGMKEYQERSRHHTPKGYVMKRDLHGWFEDVKSILEELEDELKVH